MKRVAVFLLTAGLVFGCESIDFDNPATLTNEEAANSIKDLGYKLTTSSVQNTFLNTTSGSLSVLAVYADQVTATSNANGRIFFSTEPRIELINNASHRMHIDILGLYTGFYQANLDATLALDIVERQGKRILDNSGADRTDDCLVAAYFSKGVSQAYVGAIFDRGIIVDDAANQTRDFPNSYKELILNGVSHIEKAIEIAEKNASFKFDFLAGRSISKAEFIELANSLAARLLASIPRDKAEAQALGSSHWQRVLAFAQKGLTSDLTVTYVAGGFYNDYLSSAISRLASGAQTRDWVDIKLPYLADKTGATPNFYPNTSILPAITTDDKRFYQYFAHINSTAGINAERGVGLSSTHIRVRWYHTSNALNTPGVVNPYYLAEETRLLKAEAKYWLNDISGALAELNDATAARKAKGGLDDVGSGAADVLKALHYEYAIEIDLAPGPIVPFAFMRRHDLLIGGTPTEMPVPQSQLELIKSDTYTFGGSSHFGAKGKFGETTTADNTGWKLSQ